MVLSEGSTGRGPPSKLAHVVVGRIQTLTGCWTEDLRSLLAIGQRHQFLVIWVSPIGQLTT